MERLIKCENLFFQIDVATTFHMAIVVEHLASHIISLLCVGARDWQQLCRTKTRKGYKDKSKVNGGIENCAQGK